MPDRPTFSDTHLEILRRINEVAEMETPDFSPEGFDRQVKLIDLARQIHDLSRTSDQQQEGNLVEEGRMVAD